MLSSDGSARILTLWTSCSVASEASSQSCAQHALMTCAQAVLLLTGQHEKRCWHRVGGFKPVAHAQRWFGSQTTSQGGCDCRAAA